MDDFDWKEFDMMFVEECSPKSNTKLEHLPPEVMDKILATLPLSLKLRLRQLSVKLQSDVDDSLQTWIIKNWQEIDALTRTFPRPFIELDIFYSKVFIPGWMNERLARFSNYNPFASRSVFLNICKIEYNREGGKRVHIGFFLKTYGHFLTSLRINGGHLTGEELVEMVPSLSAIKAFKLNNLRLTFPETESVSYLASHPIENVMPQLIKASICSCDPDITEWLRRGIPKTTDLIVR